MPRSREDVNLQGEWACTLKGENFVIAAEDQEDKIILLGTSTNLHRLAESDVYYTDGTFQTCPSLFYQIFTIHIVATGWVKSKQVAQPGSQVFSGFRF